MHHAMQSLGDSPVRPKQAMERARREGYGISVPSFAENTLCGDYATTDTAKRLFADIRELAPASRRTLPIVEVGAECPIWLNRLVGPST